MKSDQRCDFINTDVPQKTTLNSIETAKYCAGGIGRAGVSLRLCSAQVMELVARDTPAGSSFTSHEGGYEAPEESEEDELPEAGDLSAEQELADDNEDF